MSHDNRPGKRSLSYRIGTHPTFLHRMLDRLSGHEIPAGEHRGERPLAKLATREPGDPAIALLDAWATAADVLTYYQERIADEGYLRTAGERRSVLELARTAGHELAPGLAAGTWLAFDVDDPPGVATVPAGTPVLSIPGQDERPQTFETSRELVARVAWNRLAPAPPIREPAAIEEGRDILLAGTDVDLGPGDVLLLEETSDAGSCRLVTVRSVSPDPAQDLTRVAWDGDGDGDVTIPVNPRVHAFRRRASLFGDDAPDWLSLPKKAVTTIGKIAIEHPVSRERFDPGGKAGEWPNFAHAKTEIDLNAVYPGILAGSRILLRNESGLEQVVKVSGVRTAWRDDYTVRGKVTRIKPDQAVNTGFGLRDTVVFAESEELAPARVAESSTIGGETVDLVRVEPEPEPGQALIFAAAEVTPGGRAAAAEVTFVAAVEDVPDRPEQMRIVLAQGIERGYDPETVVIYGNVVAATHGETVREVLGSGESRRAHQRFVLRVPPLTHVAAGGGIESTLEVRVNDVLWQQVPAFFGLPKDSHGYTVHIGDDGVPTLLFGDGVRGARLPTGQENVAATYRTGGGPEGNVAAGSLVLLQTRPLGVRAVVNPLPAGGGTPRDDLEQGRVKTPLSVRTLDRLVSLRDYQTFARAFPGIGKARVALLPAAAGGRLLHLTVAGPGGAAVDRSSGLHRSLREAVEAAGDPAHPVQIDSYLGREFEIKASVGIEPDHLPELVLARVRNALAAAFSFDALDFGQGLAPSEIVAVIQGVAGVAAVDLDSPDAFLEAHPADLVPEKGIRPAELLLLGPVALTAREVL